MGIRRGRLRIAHGAAAVRQSDDFGHTGRRLEGGTGLVAGAGTPAKAAANLPCARSAPAHARYRGRPPFTGRDARDIESASEAAGAALAASLERGGARDGRGMRVRVAFA